MPALRCVMGFFSRKLADIGEFFARDLLSLAILIFLGVFLINHLASAQTRQLVASTNTQKLKQKRFVEERGIGRLNKQVSFHNGNFVKSWQLDLGLSTKQKAINNGSQSDKYNYSNSLSFEPSIKFTDYISLKGLMSYDMYSKNELQNDFSDLLLSLYFYKTKLSFNTVIRPYLVSTVPISKDSRQRQGMYFGSGAGIAISDQRYINAGTLALVGGVSAQKYFHKYETALNMALNTSYASNQQVSIAYEYKKFGISAFFKHVNAWTYTGTMKETFWHLQSFSYMATDKLSFSVGHTNSGNVLAPNQEEIDIRFIDENSSTLFLATNYIF